MSQTSDPMHTLMTTPLYRMLHTWSFLVIFLFVSSPVLHAAESGEYIRIAKAGERRIPLALRGLDHERSKDAKYADGVDAIIRNGLEFTGMFAILGSPMNLFTDGNIFDTGSRRLNMASLGSVGAELYAGGVLERDGGDVVMHMEVYDVLSGRRLLGKSYRGDRKRLREPAHEFCADFVELLTGKPSVFRSRIAYVGLNGSEKEIFMADFDGVGAEQVTRTGGLAMTPSLSGDSSRLAYLAYIDGYPELHIMDMKRGRIVPVRKKGVKIDPAWRNGSSECATTFSFDGDQEIYLVRSDGSISRRLTRARGIDVSPSFSPDGRSMAFVSSRHGLPQIFVKDLLSGKERRLTFSGRYNTQPSWSPAGDKIAYTSMQKNGEINIFTINADGTGLRQLTYRTRHNEAPSWSPDGSMIMFSSSRNGQKKLYVMNADGRNQRSLNLPGEQMQPSWSLYK